MVHIETIHTLVVGLRNKVDRSVCTHQFRQKMCIEKKAIRSDCGPTENKMDSAVKIMTIRRRTGGAFKSTAQPPRCSQWENKEHTSSDYTVIFISRLRVIVKRVLHRNCPGFVLKGEKRNKQLNPRRSNNTRKLERRTTNSAGEQTTIEKNKIND